jgi:saccharopine dehydrogenase-like NADP-dependent oxidoreductase
MRIVVLGCGFHGRGIAYQVAAAHPGEVIVADRDDARARAAGDKAGAEAVALDVRDRPALDRLLAGATTVFNATGPYHRLALGVIDAAIAAGVHYVDMNDDHEVAEAVFLDPTRAEGAKHAGVAVVLGAGIMPGLSALLVRHAYNRVEAAHTVDIRFAWNYNRAYPAAIQHFLRINAGMAPQWIEGEFVRPGSFAGRLTADFLEPAGPTEVYYTGVPDPVSLARFLPGLRNATTRGAFYQPEGNAFLEAMVRWGFASYDAVPGEANAPMEYLLEFLASDAGAKYFEIPRREVPMAVQVRVAGPDAEVIYEAHDYGRRATTAVAALTTELAAGGGVPAGAWSLEALAQAPQLLEAVASAGGIRLFGEGLPGPGEAPPAG